jgi:hypothetical protein
MKPRTKAKLNTPPPPHFSADWEKLPDPAEGWVEKPHRDRFTVRVRCIRFSDGTAKKYYLQVPKPVTQRERTDMRRRCEALLAEICTDDTIALVERERRIFGVRPNRARR